MKRFEKMGLGDFRGASFYRWTCFVGQTITEQTNKNLKIVLSLALTG